jgi:hypothetical protein
MLSVLFEQKVGDREDLTPKPYNGNLAIDGGAFLDEGLAKTRDIYDYGNNFQVGTMQPVVAKLLASLGINAGSQGGLPNASPQAYIQEAMARGIPRSAIDAFIERNPRDYHRILSALGPDYGVQDTNSSIDPSELVPQAAMTNLSELMRTGGAPDMTSALAAIRERGMKDIDQFRADERERFGNMGLSSGSDVAESVSRGASMGVSDILARQESLIASILSQAQQTRLGATQVYGQFRAQEQGNLLNTVSGLNNVRNTFSSTQLPAAQLISGIGESKMGATERNIGRDYSEFTRTNPDFMDQILSFSTGFPPQKPTVAGGGSIWPSIISALGTIGGGVAMAASSKALKDVDEEIDHEEVAKKLIGLPLHRWNYKGESQKHIGPMAETFSETFGVGDGKTIHLADVMGVMLAVNKAMAEKYIGSGRSEGARA